MTNPEPNFKDGVPNPGKFGFISLRWSAGSEPNAEKVEEAAGILRREIVFIDETGYECDLIAAAISGHSRLAYVESRSKDIGPHPHGAGRKIDISIRIHLVDADGANRSADIESYNPFFGCDVRFFEWVGDVAVLIYREKHWTFACRLGDIWPPKFIKIEDHWVIHEGQLAYVRYNEECARRLSFPELEELEPLSKEAAAGLGLLP
ncbi:MAG TPA: hypothetical protein VGJ73_03140 [Verrucomicrobiae bacterium]